ncbi:MAG: RIP metalloprotease RseP [Oxalobacteraceae bacterium]|jgi:regulator of sigma E protease|nr:RIP metalloprotease RseP [Oxalobacteraceae bacterium]
MELLQTIAAFVIVIGVLVTIHEFGHYLVARWCGVKVLRFSVGLGKIIWSRRLGPDQTEWAISAIPLGGYVKMLDARADDAGDIPEADLAREFTRQPVLRRIAIVSAGPLANFLLAIVIFAGLYVYGVPEPLSRVEIKPQSYAEQAGLRTGDLVVSVDNEPIQSWSEFRWYLLRGAMNGERLKLTVQGLNAGYRPELREVSLDLSAISPEELDKHLADKMGLEMARPPAILGEITPGGPADKAGLKAGDQIIQIDGVPIVDAMTMIETLQSAPGKLLAIDFLRGDQRLSLQVTPQSDQVGEKSVGRIFAQVDLTKASVIVKSGPLEAVARGARKTWETSAMTLTMLGKMLTGEVSLRNITGPLTIADYAGQTARVGLISFLSFMAFISISLGVMNLLPIPVLDGGHLLYYSLELFSGRQVPERIGEIAQRAGLGILMTLMAVALFNDIVRLVW